MEDFGRFLSETALKKAREFAELQNYIIELTDFSEKQALKWILESRFAQNPKIILHVMAKATMIRPENIDIHTIFIMDYSMKANQVENVKQLLLSKFILNCERLILFLARDGFITPYEIAKAIDSILKTTPDFDVSLFAFFSPEINSFYPEYISQFTEMYKNHEALHQLMQFERQFVTSYEHYQDNNWDLLNQRRFNVYEENSIEDILAEDDFASFKIYITSSDFNPSYTAQYTAYTPTVYPFINPTLIQFAALKGSVNIFSALTLLVDVDYSVKNELGVSLANFAVAGGNASIIDFVKEKKSSNFYVDALQSAAKFHRNELFKQIFEEIPDPELFTNHGDAFDAILNTCVTEENMELLLFCLGKGVDFNQRGISFRSPIHLSILGRSSEIISFLLGINTIDLNIRDNGGEPPLFTAVQVRDIDVTKQLIALANHNTPGLKNVVELTAIDDFGRNALFYAVENDDKQIVKLLINTRKFDLRHQDKFGQTVVHVAASHNALKSLKQILRCGEIDLGITDICGKTAIQIALKKGAKEAIKFISTYQNDNDSSDPESSESEEEEEEEEEDDDDDYEEEEEEEEESKNDEFIQNISEQSNPLDIENQESNENGNTENNKEEENDGKNKNIKEDNETSLSQQKESPNEEHKDIESNS